MCSDCDSTETVIDVRQISPRLRHPLIFSTFVNDHDPKPLFYQFNAEYPGIFEWTYEQQGPEVWQVRIDRLVA
jgi:uncharacterized protein (DUF2249 family)